MFYLHTLLLHILLKFIVIILPARIQFAQLRPQYFSFPPLISSPVPSPPLYSSSIYFYSLFKMSALQILMKMKFTGIFMHKMHAYYRCIKHFVQFHSLFLNFPSLLSNTFSFSNLIISSLFVGFLSPTFYSVVLSAFLIEEKAIYTWLSESGLFYLA